jgi:predicted MFS family arabinose efflux permease
MAVAGLDVPVATGKSSSMTLLTLCSATFVAQVNFFAAGPFYADMATDLETSVPLLGLLTTLLLVGSAVFGLVVGPVADRLGYRPLLVAGLLAISLNLVGTSLAPSYSALLALAIVGALGDALVFGLAFAIAAVMFSGDARRRAISWMMASLSGGAIAGVPALTAIDTLAGWRVAIASGGLLAMAVAAMTLAFLALKGAPPAGPLRLRDLVAGYRPLVADMAVIRLLGVTFLRALWFLALATYLGAYAQRELGVSSAQAGSFYLLVGVGATAGNVLAGGRLAKLSPRMMIGVANVVGGLAAGMSLVSPATLMVGLLPVAACLAGVAAVGISAQLASTSTGGPGITMVLNASLMNAGGAAGAAVGGALLAAGGYEAMAVGLPVFAVAATLLVVRGAP